MKSQINNAVLTLSFAYTSLSLSLTLSVFSLDVSILILFYCSSVQFLVVYLVNCRVQGPLLSLVLCLMAIFYVCTLYFCILFHWLFLFIYLVLLLFFLCIWKSFPVVKRTKWRSKCAARCVVCVYTITTVFFF